MKSSDLTPRNVAHTIQRAVNAVARTDRQRARNVNAKRYHPDDYAHALHSRRERERVTGNKEEGPL